jgi:hypothetical protein
VISTACFSGSWTSALWTLLAAAGPDQHAPSIVVSGSGECQGGFFANVLLAEYAHEFNIRLPYPGSIYNRGLRGRQREHDFGPEKTLFPSPQLPKRSLQDIINWIHQFRDDIRRTHSSANIMCHPCRGTSPPPFRLLGTGKCSLHQLKCVPPSPAGNYASVHSASTHRPAISTSQSVSEEPRKLSGEEEAELIDLAANLLTYMPPSISSERSVILRCWRIIYGPARGIEPLRRASEQTLLGLEEQNTQKGARPRHC